MAMAGGSGNGLVAQKRHVRHPHRDAQLQKVRPHILGPKDGLLDLREVPDLQVSLLTGSGHQLSLGSALSQPTQPSAHLQAFQVLGARLFRLLLRGILALQLSHVLHFNVDGVELDWGWVAPQLY
jgi:hypothetical protein